MAEEIDRIYIIPLRTNYSKEPRSKRSNRALRKIKEFVRKHAKTKEMKISRGLNELIFSRGFKKPPGKIKVEVKGNLSGVLIKLPGEIIVKKEEKQKKGIAGLKERLTGKTEEKKKSAVEEKVKEATSEEKVKEAAEKVKKEEDKKKEEKKTEKKNS